MYSDQKTVNLRLNAKAIVWVCSGALVIITVFHGIAFLPVIFMGRSNPLGFFSFSGEHNLPSLFSVGLLWSNALLAGCIAWAEKNAVSRRIWWIGVAIAFTLAGLDEGLMIHERLREARFDSMAAYFRSAFLWYVIVPGGFVLLLIVYRGFLRHLPLYTRRLMLVAAVLTLVGSLGIDYLGHAWFALHGKDAVCYFLLTIEELLEMIGSIVSIYAFSSFIQNEFPGLSLTFEPPDSP